MRYKLIGSDSDLNNLLKNIEQKYFFNNVKVIKIKEKPIIFSIYNSFGEIYGYRIILKNNRYRFEITI